MAKRRIKRKKKIHIDFIFKTAIDGLLAGLLSIGIYLGRPPSTKSAESYELLLALFLSVALIMVLYAYTKRKARIAYGLFVVLGVSIVEVILIGIIFQETTTDIMITLFIIAPSVLIFDKLLG
ncbi:hypothetical protein LCGC14_1350690 [marine sediment metagenome]|uniref:Uncharacterized protein n=1 Tax=marine sediment metagenome TaxID=412755 RepID=A0A0F9KB39_9ZZZZ